jgi:hypothetical protein
MAPAGGGVFSHVAALSCARAGVVLWRVIVDLTAPSRRVPACLRAPAIFPALMAGIPIHQKETHL